jgi:hypothetical protein
MFVHIVIWRLRDDAENGKSKDENARQMQRQFHAMRGHLRGLLRLDCGVDISRTGDSADVALYTEFEDKAAYDEYYAHPLHLEIMGFIKGVRSERRVVDYEV